MVNAVNPISESAVAIRNAKQNPAPHSGLAAGQPTVAKNETIAAFASRLALNELIASPLQGSSRQERLNAVLNTLNKAWLAERVSLWQPSKPGSRKLAVQALACSGLIDTQLSEAERLGLHRAATEAAIAAAPTWSTSLAPDKQLCATLFTPKLLSPAARLAVAQNPGTLLLVPFGKDGILQGCMAIEWSTRALNPEHLRSWPELVGVISEQISTCAPLLWLVQSQRGSSTTAVTAFRRALPTRWLAIAVALLAVGLAAIPINSPVSAPARVEAQTQRQLAAPSAGVLKAVYATPGDFVKAGQLIAELKEQDFELEKNRLQSERSIQEGNYRNAMAKGDRSAMMQAQSKAAELSAQLSLVDNQIANIQIRAPIDGQLISIDLAPLVGNPIDRGQSLGVIAPSQKYRVIIELPETQFAKVQVGQVGQLALAANPFEALPLTVTRIAPATTLAESSNVVEVVAHLQSASARELKPGLRGVVHLQSEKQAFFTIQWERIKPTVAQFIWRWFAWAV